MGRGVHGGFKNTAGRGEKHSLADNLPNVQKRFVLSVDGYFGEASSRKNSVARIIEDSAPIDAAYDFFNRMTDGYDKIEAIPYPDGSRKGEKAIMADGTVVTIRRRSSSDGSPAIDIKIESPGRVKPQKIHFVKKGSEK